ncbi:UDP-2,3-diacylglucosamine diphosphatase [Thauera linaloolentis]|uniref:Metallophosphoesterase n=1 Tax=Thauera linaloolentis (strain DSM 12138 / JCM 21573 / CCUG 41526 / CIP 105981 / IAM 15112 / NBRC 102519 / 47Lol) TaxID=1123367 RepID=N6XYA7_THAL4|nr:UDP-2,3-diacylglucosamine diphosphatase [Thauera linaloolentis]ENO86796.1 metallophosphoesterase [Thauera linaloolentis 47Lol = DSM 12138]MCM8564822.1 UDP-2,3-diacylglucosamine diphosphatase [Thauera linaloolentis]
MPAVRTIFISDVHLGTRASQAERLRAFLKEYESEYLYLLGDIIDFWAMSRSVQWAPAHNTVVQKVLRRARQGDKVFFIPGNHDETLREYVGTAFGNIRIEREWVHETIDGRRYWLIHGDEYDQVTRHHRWVAVLGDVAYNTLVRLNIVLSRVRRFLHIPGYWSLAGYAKQKVKRAVSFIFDFEDAVAHAAQQRGVDGVICGHIHSVSDRRIGKVRYLNCGDWVDTCSAVVEHYDGRIEVLRWGMEATVPLPVAEAEARPPLPAAGKARSPLDVERIYLTPDV